MTDGSRHDAVKERLERDTPAHGQSYAPWIPKRLRQIIGRARTLLFVEDAVVRVTPLISVSALILSLALFGLWQVVPWPFNAVLSILAVAAILASLWPLVRLKLPETEAAVQRVETASGFSHRPLQTLGDRQATGTEDPLSRRLWEAHRARALAKTKAARTGSLRARLAAADPMALRVIPVLSLIVAAAYASGDWQNRLLSVVQPPRAVAITVPPRLDAWVTPPVYTGEAPIFLTASDTPRDPEDDGVLAVPVNSRLEVQVEGSGEVSVTVTSGGAEDALLPDTEAGSTGSSARYVHELVRDAEVEVAVGGHEGEAWSFSLVPDRPPEISLIGEPDSAVSGALQLEYQLSDDYGVVAAEAQIRPVQTAGAGDDARPLVEPPDFPLSLPAARVTEDQGRTYRDLTAHPLAGAEATLTMVAKDEAGQEGRTAPVTFTLPERRFHDPLARAVVEQRRILALDAGSVPIVSTALNALTIGPEEFFDNTGHYLLLRSAYWRLQNADDDDDLRALLDYLWDIALTIEDGDLSLAERRLRDAQEALMRALENDAPAEEIARLVEELRQAMSEYMRALAENMEQLPEADTSQLQDPSQTVTPQDLQRMLDMIEDLARTGSRDAARQMLSELQNMLENLQNAQRMPQQGGEENALSDALRQLQEMIQQQQNLMDQTFELDRQGPGRQDQQQFGQGQQGQGGYQDQLDQLGQGQQGVRESLQSLLQQLQELGLDPGQTLGQAGQPMQDAEGNLRGGDTGEAVANQSEALERLREGTQGLVQQLMEQLAQQGQSPGNQSRDPLGRLQRNEGPDFGEGVQVPDEIDIQRARRILNELRRRLGDAHRETIEREYLERLITPF